VTVVVTGLGACAPLGADADSLWAGVARGDRPFTRYPRWRGADPAPWAAAFVADRLAGLAGPAPDLDPALGLAARAAREAIAQAGLGPADLERAALVLGTSAGAANRYAGYRAAPPAPGPEARAALRRTILCEQASLLAEALGVAGPRLVVSTACASGTHAVGLARDLLAEGAVDVVLAVGTDALVDMSFEGFGALGAAGDEPCAPFSQPEGVTLGEGAGCLVLEREDGARARGAARLAEVAGFGGSSDAWHEAAPDPSGDGIARSLRAALADARLVAEDVDYVNAHGTGTGSGDLAEALAIEQVFAPQPPVSSSKSQLGHTLGGAGALEALITVQALLHQALPPTAGFRAPRRVAPEDPVGEGVARPASLAVAMSTSSAFGGLNATVVLRRPAGGRAVVSPPTVGIAGVGHVRALGVEARGRRRRGGCSRPCGRTPWPTRRTCRRSDATRRSDPRWPGGRRRARPRGRSGRRRPKGRRSRRPAAPGSRPGGAGGC